MNLPNSKSDKRVTNGRVNTSDDKDGVNAPFTDGGAGKNSYGKSSAAAHGSSASSTGTGWSDGRRSERESSNSEAKVTNLNVINAVLLKLSKDNDLAEDLEHPPVKRALLHWTNVERLDSEEAALLQDNYRVVSVLQKLQSLQHVCSQAGIPVPLDLFLQGKSELSLEIRNKILGDNHSYNSSTSAIPAAKATDKHDDDKSQSDYMQAFDDELHRFEKDVRVSRQMLAEAADTDTDIDLVKPLWKRILFWGYESPESPKFLWWRFIARSIIDAILLVLTLWLMVKIGPRKGFPGDI